MKSITSSVGFFKLMHDRTYQFYENYLKWRLEDFIWCYCIEYLLSG